MNISVVNKRYHVVGPSLSNVKTEKKFEKSYYLLYEKLGKVHIINHYIWYMVQLNTTTVSYMLPKKLNYSHHYHYTHKYTS